MDLLNELYYKSIAENERNLRFWNDYLENLKSLDFNLYSEKLKIPILVPIGSRILFRGELKHTNEVTVALGADYFVKCSIKQADILKQHRIKGAQEKVDIYNKEREHLLNQMSFTKENIYDKQSQEIIEYHTDEEDKAWREKHKKNMRDYMQKKGKEKENIQAKDEITDEELWERLEELELQEELENELSSGNDFNTFSSLKVENKNSFIVKDDDSVNINKIKCEVDQNKKDEVKAEKEMKNKKVTFKPPAALNQPTKLDLLQQVIDRQNELDKKLHELKNRERSQTKTEKDLMSRLDELEQLDELEDEMDRLDDIIENEDVDESEDEESIQPAKLQRRVSFVDEDDSKTLHLTFKHSDVDSNSEPYNPDVGIQKPSDIYAAYSNLFANGTTSILKKSKYNIENEESETMPLKPVIKVEKDIRKTVEQPVLESDELTTPKTIVIKDVVEKAGQGDSTLQTESKPMSLFKKKRMQNKS